MDEIISIYGYTVDNQGWRNKTADKAEIIISIERTSVASYLLTEIDVSEDIFHVSDFKGVEGRAIPNRQQRQLEESSFRRRSLHY